MSPVIERDSEKEAYGFGDPEALFDLFSRNDLVPARGQYVDEKGQNNLTCLVGAVIVEYGVDPNLLYNASLESFYEKISENSGLSVPYLIGLESGFENISPGSSCLTRMVSDEDWDGVLDGYNDGVRVAEMAGLPRLD